MTGGAAALCLVTLIAWVSGCDRTENTSSALAEAIHRANAHAKAFAEYETWVVRALSVGPSETNRQALTETLFAPIRNTGDVIGVMVLPNGKSQPTLSFPAGAPWADWDSGLAVKHPTLGWVRVAIRDPCPTHRPRRRDSGVRSQCVLIARDADHAQPGTPRLMMAFAPTAATEAPSRTK